MTNDMTTVERLSRKRDSGRGYPEQVVFIVGSEYPSSQPRDSIWVRTTLQAAEDLVNNLLLDEIEDMDTEWKLEVSAFLEAGEVHKAVSTYNSWMEGCHMYITPQDSKGYPVGEYVTEENRSKYLDS